MRLLKFTLAILGFGFIAFSCNDSSETCSQADWVGVYTGTQTCNGETVDATVTITASGESAIIVSILADGTTIELDPADIDGCNYDIEGRDAELSLSADGSLSGETVTFNTELFIGGQLGSRCTITGTR